MSNDSNRPGPPWDDETWSLALSAMQRLEVAWRSPGLPNLADFVPVARDDPRCAAILIRLIDTDRQCRCRVNVRKEPADYLAQWPELRDRQEFAALFDKTLDHHDRPAAVGWVDPVGWVERSEPHHREPNAPPSPPPSPLQPCAFRILCPHCHQAVEVLDQDPLVDMSCPSCGSSLSLVDRGVPVDRSIAGQARIRRRIAHFELIEQLGVGAFGSVWKAKDTQLDTLVAVKIPRSGQLDAEEAERFIREARAAAQLHHANIVGVQAVGRDGDQLYIVSELIGGLPLDQWRGDRRLECDEAAALCAKIADALDYAHQHGVIHRDLKPQNILMDDRGEPHLTDFGLAKREMGEMTMTVQGQVLGTPAYLSPEQAAGRSHEADRRSDIYSLGVVLFELLTGERPFRGSLAMLLRQHVEDDAPSPRRLVAGIPRDLETICLKCLEKEPRLRYQSAGEIAAELRRFRAKEPILARPIGKPEQLWRWCRRQPVVAGLAATVATLLVSVTVVALIGYVKTTHALLRESNAHQAAESERQKATDALQRERRTVDAMRWTLYASTVRLADQEWDRGNMGTAVSLLDKCPEHLRGWEWDRLQYACHFGEWYFRSPSQANYDHIDCSPDEKELVMSSCDSGNISIWDTTTGNKKATLADGQYGACPRVAWSPVGPRVAASTQKGVIIWNATNRTKVCRVDGASPDSDYHLLAWSPNGRMLATVVHGTVLKVWNTETGSNLFTFDKGLGGITGITWSPDSKLVAISSHSGIIQILDPIAAKLVSEFAKGTEGPITAVCWSHDPQLLASAGYDNVVRVWKLEKDKAVLINELPGHTAPVFNLAWCPDDNYLASCGEDRLLKIWDLRKGAERATIRGAGSRLLSLRWTRDHKWLLSTNHGRLALFETQADNDARNLWAGGTSRTLSWRSDNRHLATGDRETCYVWDTRSRQLVFRVRAHRADVFWKPGVQAVAFSHNGKFLATAGMDKSAKIWDAESRSEVKDLRAELAEEGQDHFRPQTHFELKCLRGHTGTVHSLDWSPDDTKLVTASADGSVRVWDAATGKQSCTLVKSGPPVQSVAWSHDGQLIASGGDDKTVSIWKVDSRRLVFSLTGHERAVTSLAWSPDGKRLISAGGGSEAFKIWNLATGALERNLSVPCSGPVCAWSPDGSRLAIAGDAPCARIFDPVTGDELLSLRGHAGPMGAVAWSPDGKSLASVDLLGRLKIWDTENRYVPEWGGLTAWSKPK